MYHKLDIHPIPEEMLYVNAPSLVNILVRCNTANPADGKPSVRTSGNRLMYEFTHTMIYPGHTPLAWNCHVQHQ